VSDVQGAANIVGQGNLKFGNIIRTGFSVFKIPVIVPVILIGAAIAFLVTYFFPPPAIATPETLSTYLPGALLRAGIVLVIEFILGAIVAFAVFEHLAGRAISFGQCVALLVPRLLPYLVLLVISSVLESLGFLLLVVVGVILALMWYVAGPALLIEKLGPIASLQRSAFLTKGSKGQLFGLSLLLVLVFAGFGVVQFVLQFLIPVVVVKAAIIAVIGQIAYAYGFSVLTVVYRDLRRLREGPESGAVAAVFS